MRAVTRSLLATICHCWGHFAILFQSFIRRSGVSHNTLFTEGSMTPQRAPLKAKEPICSIPPWVKLEPSPQRRVTVICVLTPPADRAVFHVTSDDKPACHCCQFVGRFAGIVLTWVRYRSVGRTSSQERTKHNH